MDREIIWNLINSGLAGGLVFLGGCSTGEISLNTIYYSLMAGVIAGVIQFKDYWSQEKDEYKTIKLFKFL